MADRPPQRPEHALLPLAVLELPLDGLDQLVAGEVAVWKTDLTSVSYWLRLTPSIIGRFSSPWKPEGQMQTSFETCSGMRSRRSG